MPSSSIDSSRLRAITGSCTLSSKLPAAPAHATAASLPMTWVATCSTASHRTGFTLPGMIELPGCRSGRRSSPSPAAGPEPIHRMSSAILARATATTRSRPDASTRASRDALCGHVVGRLGERQLRLLRQPGDDRGGEARRDVDAGADGAAAEGQLADAGQRVAQPLGRLLDLGRVAAELLAEGHGRGVHQVRAAGLHHVGEWPAACRGATWPGGRAPGAGGRRCARPRRGASPPGTGRSRTAAR